MPNLEDWHNEFENRRWHNDGGNFHSLSWMVWVYNFLLGSPLGDNLHKLSSWSKSDEGIKYSACTIHDHGCGEGDGTMYLKSVLPFATVKGLDFWPEAIEICKDRWTELDVSWEVDNVSNPTNKCDVIFCTQAMDHVEDIASAINNCLKKCKILVVSWAQLSHKPEHASIDKSWMDNVPEPAFTGLIPKPRLVRDLGSILTDFIEIYVWAKTDDSR